MSVDFLSFLLSFAEICPFEELREEFSKTNKETEREREREREREK